MTEMALLIAEGRGSNPGGVGAVFIILGIALVVLLGAAAAHFLQTKRARVRPDAHDRKPSRRTGRVSKQEGP